MKQWTHIGCGAVLALMLAACGGGGNDYDGELATEGGSGDGTTDQPSTPQPDVPETPDDVSNTDCSAEVDRFAEQLWQPVLSGSCLTCHQSGGIAASSGLVLQAGNDSTALSTNLQRVSDYIASNGSGLLVQKPLGQVAHGGGAVISPNSAEHQAMLTWLQTDPVSCSTDGEEPEAPDKQIGSVWQGVNNAGASDTLRKAALLFAGRLPTAAEVQSLGDGSDESLRRVIRGLMTGEGFDQFVLEGANDRLLTNKWANGRTPALDLLYDGGDRFPYIEARLQPLNEAVNNATSEAQREAAERARNQAWERTNEALAMAPLQLIRYIVTSERPYTEVLTADYIMVNPYSNDVYNTGVSFANDQNEDDWRPARITSGYSLGPLPHAGVLSSQMFLARYPSTDTNRNRARSRWAYYFFLGVDIEGLAVRSMDPDALADNNNPTMNNPACTGCHTVMDPVAGAFQNFGDSGLYRDAWDGDDSLPDTYKDSGLYQEGDLWYRDMRIPGFNGAELPQSQQSQGLQWLAQQMVADARFASGTVQFWWPAVFAAEPLAAPTETSDQDYAQRLAVYQEQQRMIADFAQRLRSGASGNGAYNLKDMLVDMAVSPAFRADTVVPGSTPLASDMGRGQLLTAEQLNRKLEASTGGRWHHVWNEDDALLLDAYYGIYGGIDSDTVVERGRQLNTMMYAVANRMSSEMVCSLVVNEFEQPQSQRVLFTEVESTDTPQSNATSVRLQVNRLIDRLWGNPLTDLNTEQTQVYALFEEVWQSRLNSAPSDYLFYNDANEPHDDNDEYCRLDWDNADNGALLRDPNHTLRAWMAVLSYLLADFAVLHE
ncbi:hypothetical protein CHH28_19125 [Bacterioplanes sanyensis]|uniref:Uncharacterized protein n=1 Tax=Bacterioplanes sanyensis TaxID=1249553 RepID=A0A222FNQ7_9GAMM|nr:DUF1588 domain-containing protein [Bacterioplanes sanyensis]ASP40647.1 hypothetical protein CHH28_19125 [Bacterioplanes sanyensis]